MVNYVPDRGDIVWLDFDHQKGKEISKTRPALVVSQQKYNEKTNLALFLPITSQIKNYPFELELDEEEMKGVILCDQIRSLDWHARKARKITTVSRAKIKLILSKFQLLIEY